MYEPKIKAYTVNMRDVYTSMRTLNTITNAIVFGDAGEAQVGQVLLDLLKKHMELPTIGGVKVIK